MLRGPCVSACIAACAALAGCNNMPVPRIPGVTPYKIDIQQGNYISQDQVAQLKAGMTKEQVRNLLGTPLLTDIFHANRWDYLYYREQPDGKREQRKLVVFFDPQDRLQRVEGDVVAAQGATQQGGK